MMVAVAKGIQICAQGRRSFSSLSIRSSAKDDGQVICKGCQGMGVDGLSANVRPVMWGMAQRRGSMAMMKRGPERRSS